MNLAGVTVAVTGAGSGIGAALAEEAAARGASAVAIIDVDEAAAGAVADRIARSGVRSAAFGCDISDVAAVERTAADVAASLGVPGLVCANAGVSPAASPVLDASADDLRWALSVNVIGTWATLRAFGRQIIDNSGSGWLLVTASEHAIGVPFAGNGLYTLTKHAVLGLSDVLRRELPEGIGISVALPGLAATGLWRSGALRPDELGGPLADSDLARELLSRGMAPELVAKRILDGVRDERFLIATHPHALAYAAERMTDVSAAFDALAETGADEAYHVADIIADIVAEQSGSAGT